MSGIVNEKDLARSLLKGHLEQRMPTRAIAEEGGPVELAIQTTQSIMDWSDLSLDEARQIIEEAPGIRDGNKTDREYYLAAVEKIGRQK